MMVYKCDRCGAIFDNPSWKDCSVKLHLSDEAIDEEECDICEDCYTSLVAWYKSNQNIEVNHIIFDSALINDLYEDMKNRGGTKEEFDGVKNSVDTLRNAINKYMTGESDG